MPSIERGPASATLFPTRPVSSDSLVREDGGPARRAVEAQGDVTLVGTTLYGGARGVSYARHNLFVVDRYVRYANDAIAPQVVIVSPPVETPLGKFAPIVFQLTDNLGLVRQAVLVVEYVDLRGAEVAHNGLVFSGPYAGSTRDSIPNGWEFALRRFGGWPGAPTLRVYAVDTVGNPAP